MTACLNEVDRAVVCLPDDATIYGSPTYLPITFDAAGPGEAARPALLTRTRNGVHYQAQYEIFYALCADRAQKAVDGQLVVDGAQITPERYLRLWRSAIEGARPPQSICAQYGLAIFAVLRAPLAAASDARSSWSCCPFKTFKAFRAKHGPSMSVDAAGVFTLELDLQRPQAARDAYYGASMLCSVFEADSPDWQATLEVRAVRASPSQAGLFPSQTAEV